MNKQKENILNEYRNEYKLMSYYDKLLYLNFSKKIKLTNEEKRLYMNSYLMHTYTLNLLSRLLSERDHKNYLPDVRAAAIVKRNKMIENFLSRKGSETA